MTTFIKLYLILFAAFFTSENPADVRQVTLEKEVNLKSGQSVSLALTFANEIKVQAWDKNKLYIKAIVAHNFEEELDFHLNEINDPALVKIEEKISNLEDGKTLNFKNKDQNRCCIQLNISYEIYLPTNTDLHIKSISGNMEIKNMNGLLNLETISGFVDVEINSSEKYHFNCSTLSGSIYSDLTFDKNMNIKGDLVGTKLNSSINGGGKKLNLKSISGDLYLRKK